MRELFEYMYLFCEANRAVTLMAILVFSGLIYAKPKPVLRLISIFFFLGVVYYFCSIVGDATFSGIKHEAKLAQKDVFVKDL